MICSQLKQNYNLMSTKHQPGFMPYDRTGNRVLIKSELGKAKPSDYDLPAENFVYGTPVIQDPEKAREVIYKWLEHQNSENKNNSRIKDFVNTNKAALKQLAHTSSDNGKFRKTNTMFKTFREGTNQIKIKLPEEGFAYGKPLELEDPIRLVLANNYGEEDKLMRSTMYQQRASEQPKRRLSCHITKSHNLVKEATAKKMALFDWTRRAPTKQQWKLSKFNQTVGKVDTNRKRFTSALSKQESSSQARN